MFIIIYIFVWCSKLSRDKDVSALLFFKKEEEITLVRALTVWKTYHGYMDCELHPHPHTDDKDDRWDSTQADLGQTHETKQFHHSYSQHNNLQRKKRKQSTI